VNSGIIGLAEDDRGKKESEAVHSNGVGAGGGAGSGSGAGGSEGGEVVSLLPSMSEVLLESGLLDSDTVRVESRIASQWEGVLKDWKILCSDFFYDLATLDVCLLCPFVF
jgi:hypothetical protein